MKRMIIGVLLLLPLSVQAREYKENPDRYPSIGFEVAKGQVPGIPKAGVNGEQTNGGTVGFLGDFRLPVSDALTLHTSIQSDGINNNLAFTEGYRLAVGLRVYIRD